MPLRTLLLAALVGLLSSPHAVAAQAMPGAQYRQGFWIGFGLGPGHGQIDCARCGPLLPNDPWEGGAGIGFYLAMGGTPRPNLLVGGEVNGYGKRNESQNRDATLASAGVVAQYYPITTGRFYLKGGAGLGGSNLAGGNGLIESTGWSLQGGAGYDLLLGRRFALVPFAHVVQVFSEGDQGHNQGQVAFGPRNPRYVQYGLGFHWY
jgi:hypothetical protein